MRKLRLALFVVAVDALLPAAVQAAGRLPPVAIPPSVGTVRPGASEYERSLHYRLCVPIVANMYLERGAASLVDAITPASKTCLERFGPFDDVAISNMNRSAQFDLSVRHPDVPVGDDAAESSEH